MAAYNGTEKYIFISYAHRDNAVALPIIEGLISRGMRVWYDGGIEVGTDWAEFIEDRILGCECLILLLSRESVESVNCREEFALARESGRKILICYIEDLEPSDLKHGLRLRVPTYQCMYLSRYPSVDAFLDAVCRARILEGCGDVATAADKSYESPMEEEARLLALQGVTVHSTEADATKRPTATDAGRPIEAKKPTAPVADRVKDAKRPVAPAADSPKEAKKPVAPAATVSAGLDIRDGLLFGIGECTDTHIVVPSGVSAVAPYAFADNRNVREITLPSGVTEIGERAFLRSALTKIELPSGLVQIGHQAFCGCRQLEAVHLPDGLEVIGDEAFNNCNRIREINFPEGLLRIGKRAFSYCNFLKASLPESLVVIEDYAFSNNSVLSDVTIRKGVKKICAYAFGSCHYLAGAIPYAINYSGSYDEWCAITITTPILTGTNRMLRCSDGRIYDAHPAPKPTVPPSSPFYIPSAPSAAEIFGTAPTTATMPKPTASATPAPATKPEPTTTYERAFGKSMYSINQRALKGRGTFLDNYGALTAGEYSEGLSITSLGLLMGPGSFKGEMLVLPPNVLMLDVGVFRGNKRLTSVILNDSIKVIPKAAFEKCTSLTRVSLPYFLSCISEQAFFGCKQINSVNLTHGVTQIGNRAFAGCDNLCTVSLPTDIRSLGRYALGDAENVTIYFGGSKAEWDAIEKNGPVARSYCLICIDGYTHKEGWK